MKRLSEITTRHGGHDGRKKGIMIGTMSEAKEVAKRLATSEEWNEDDCRQLCHMAEIEDEYDKADGEDFEKVVQKAADILGVDIYEECYIVVDVKGADEFDEEFTDKDEAIKYANDSWNALTDSDKSKRSAFYVLKSANADKDASDHFDGDVILDLMKGE